MLFDKLNASLTEAVKKVQEKAVSQAQQKLMAMALSYKRGEMSDDEASDKVKQLANSMSEKDLEDFAKTKHDEVPAKSEKEEGNAFSKALMAAKEKGDKTFTVAGKKYDVKTEQELDPVNKKAVKKDFDDRKDKDIDNDGDVDDSDEYLHNRRKTVSKATKNEEVDLDEGIQDKKAVAAMKAMLDGMSKEDAIKKYGVSPKKLDALRKSMFKEEDDLEEATTKKAKEGPDAAGQEKLEPRAKGEKEFADKHDVEEKDGEEDEADSMKKIAKDVKKASDNKVKSFREALLDVWSK